MEEMENTEDMEDRPTGQKGGSTGVRDDSGYVVEEFEEDIEVGEDLPR